MFNRYTMPMYPLIVAIFTGGGGWLGADLAAEALLDMGDKRWVTVASQNLQIEWNLKDEIQLIQGRIDRGEQTPDDLARIAVLRDRLRRIQVIKK